jgi:hypothetical protein
MFKSGSEGMLQRRTAAIRARSRFFDCTIVVLSLLCASWLRIHIVGVGAPGEPLAFDTPLGLFPIVCAIWLIAFQWSNLYRPADHLNRWATLWRLAMGHATAALLFFGVLYLTYREYSRLQGIYFLILSFVGLSGYRLLLSGVQFGTPQTCRVLIIGADDNALRIARTVERYGWLGFAFAGFVRLAEQPHSEASSRVIGTLDNLEAIIHERQIREVIIAFHWSDGNYPAEVVRRLQAQTGQRVSVRLAPDYRELASYHITTESFGGFPLIGVREDVFTAAQRFQKRAFDVVVSALVLTLGLPIYLMIALAIWLEARRGERMPVQHGEVPLDGSEQPAAYRWHPQAPRRPARHPCWALPAAYQSGRTPAVRKHPARRDEPCRAAPGDALAGRSV